MTRVKFPLLAPLRPILGALLGSLLSLQSATGAKFCVAPGGNDANPGTKELPFASIHRAQQAVAPGDTVYIRSGVYPMTESEIAVRDSFLASITGTIRLFNVFGRRGVSRGLENVSKLKIGLSF